MPSLRVRLLAEFEGSELILAIFQRSSLVVATAIREEYCLVIKDISCTGDSDSLVMSKKTLPDECPTFHTLK